MRPDVGPDGSPSTFAGDLASLCIPRHGSRPTPVPTNWPTDRPLPGAIHVSFFDGHGEPVKLDRLWQLYWHKGYQRSPSRQVCHNQHQEARLSLGTGTQSLPPVPRFG